MGKAKDATSAPATKSGQVIARFPQIEAWFRAGFKSQEVHQKLVAEGIGISKVLLLHLLSRYGKTESAVRRAIAAEAGFVTESSVRRAPVAREVSTPVQKRAEKPATKTTEVLKRKDRGRVLFRPSANPGKEDLI